MKKLILIITLCVMSFGFGQETQSILKGALEVPTISFKQQYTIAERDALTVGANDRKLIYVVDTGVNENQLWNGTAWVTLGGGGNFIPLTGTEVGSPVSGNIQFQDSLKVVNVVFQDVREEIDSTVVRLTKNSINIDGQFLQYDYINFPSRDNPQVFFLDSFAVKHDMRGSYYNRGAVYRSVISNESARFFNDTISSGQTVLGYYGRETFFTKSAFNNNKLEYNAATGTFDVKADTFTFDINGSTGTNGQVLTSDGTNATWQDASGGGLNYGTRLTASITGATNLDWSTDNTVFDYTLTGSTTLANLNIPTGTETKVIELYITGDFALTLPATWTALPGNDAYLGTGFNHIIVTCINGTTSSEIILYSLTNI